MIPRTCSVALPIPAETTYSYSVPVPLAERVTPGSRVVVSLRSRMLVGLVVDCSSEEREGLKPVLLAPDAEPLVSGTLIALASWMAGYYFTPLGVTLKAMLPGSLWGKSRIIVHEVDAGVAAGGTSGAVMTLLKGKGGKASASFLSKKMGRPIWDTLQRMERGGAIRLETELPNLGPAAGTVRNIVLLAPPQTLLERESFFGRARKQRHAFETIDALGGEVSVKDLKSKHGVSAAVIKALVDRGVAKFRDQQALRDPFAELDGTAPEKPDRVQQEVIDRLRGAPAGSTYSLFGVTGSGKTLVYLEAVRREVEAGKGVIVLVPEIALTPQTIARVKGVFGGEVAVLHSALSEGERADAWRALASGEKRVAVGARSAVFAPIQNLAAIIVDEEHESSYKNGEAPRYSARDVAIRRAQLEGARAILSSATPSLETWAARESIVTVRLPNRVSGRPLPKVRLVNLLDEPRVEGSGALPWTRVLDRLVARRLTDGEQVILLLNRRGYAHFLQCGSCGEVEGCPNCSIALTVHSVPRRLFCHYCGYSQDVSSACSNCGSGTTESRGVGTQQLERWLGERFPEARIARMDADTTTGRWSHHRILDDFGNHEIDLLFGTQMIAKGLDFPNVTLVGVIDADTGLNLPDFRSAERTFQLVTQVAGRSGRGEKGGEVVVQTRNPEHYALARASEHDFEGFAALEMELRRNPAYPPLVGLINIVVSGLAEPKVQQAAGILGEWLRGLVKSKTDGDVDVVGPAPCPLARIKNRWRWHLLIRSANREMLGRLGQYGAKKAPNVVRSGVRVIFDRDPTSLL